MKLHCRGSGLAIRRVRVAHLLKVIHYKTMQWEKMKRPQRSLKGACDDQATLKGRKFVLERCWTAAGS